jgi:hypothetical protein
MFGVGDHDASTIEELLGGIALAGFFAAGEIGPIAGRNALHGFTASMALFIDAVDKRPPPRRRELNDLVTRRAGQVAAPLLPAAPNGIAGKHERPWCRLDIPLDSAISAVKSETRPNNFLGSQRLR